MGGKQAPAPLYVFRPSHQDLGASQPSSSGGPSRSINHLDFISLRPAHLPPHLALLTLDNHGWVSIWNLDSRRIQSLWLAHPRSQTVGGGLWAAPLHVHRSDSSSPHSHDLALHIISQGRDHKLKLHRLENYVETCTISTIARANVKPTINAPSSNVTLVAEASINAINFCKAGLLTLPPHPSAFVRPGIHSVVAVPSSVSEESVDIFGVQIEGTARIFKIYQAILNGDKTHGKSDKGSVVAVQLFAPPGAAGALTLLVIGSESGEVHVLKNGRVGRGDETDGLRMNSDWQSVARFKCHTEPILSLALSIDPADPLAGIAWSVGVDRTIARYSFSCREIHSGPAPSAADEATGGAYEVEAEAKVFETNQVGRFEVRVRTDGKVVGIYNWGGKIWLFDSQVIMDRAAGRARGGYPTFSLRPIGLLTLPTEPDTRSGVLAFAPFPPPPAAPSPLTLPHQLDSLAHAALLVASGAAGHVSAWEVFPPLPPPQH